MPAVLCSIPFLLSLKKIIRSVTKRDKKKAFPPKGLTAAPLRGGRPRARPYKTARRKTRTGAGLWGPAHGKTPAAGVKSHKLDSGYAILSLGAGPIGALPAALPSAHSRAADRPRKRKASVPALTEGHAAETAQGLFLPSHTRKSRAAARQNAPSRPQAGKSGPRILPPVKPHKSPAKRTVRTPQPGVGRLRAPFPEKRHARPGRADASVGQPLSFSRMPPWLRYSAPAKGGGCTPFSRMPPAKPRGSTSGRAAAACLCAGIGAQPRCGPPGPEAANALFPQARRGLCRPRTAAARVSLRSARILLTPLSSVTHLATI